MGESSRLERWLYDAGVGKIKGSFFTCLPKRLFDGLRASDSR